MGNGAPPEVMLVEADGPARQQMKAFLETEGYAVTEVDSGSAALHRLSGLVALPDAIVIERDSPFTGTTGFLQALRSYRRFLDLPVVVVNAKPGVDPRALMCIAYVPRPAPPAALPSVLRAIIFAKGTAPP